MAGAENKKSFKENTRLSAKVDRTQNEFNEYIDNLSFAERCKYMSSILNIVNFCDYTAFNCRFRKKESYRHKDRMLYECSRERTKQLKQILGSKLWGI